MTVGEDDGLVGSGSVDLAIRLGSSRSWVIGRFESLLPSRLFYCGVLFWQSRFIRCSNG